MRGVTNIDLYFFFTKKKKGRLKISSQSNDPVKVAYICYRAKGESKTLIFVTPS